MSAKPHDSAATRLALLRASLISARLFHRPASHAREVDDDVTAAARYPIRDPPAEAEPVFTLFAIAILAIGIGLNATIFGLVDAMLLRPPPFAEPDRIVHLYQDSDAGVPTSTAFPAYRDIAAISDVFTDVAASRSGGIVNWETEAGPQAAA